MNSQAFRILTVITVTGLTSMNGWSAPEGGIDDSDYLLDISNLRRSMSKPVDLGFTLTEDELVSAKEKPTALSRYETYLYCRGVWDRADKKVDLRKEKDLLGFYTFEFKNTSKGVEVKWIHRDTRFDQKVGEPFVYGPFSLSKLASHIHYFSSVHAVKSKEGSDFGPQEISSELTRAGIPANQHVQVVSASYEEKNPTALENLRAMRDDLLRIYSGRLGRCRDQGYFSEEKVSQIRAAFKPATQERSRPKKAQLTHMNCAWGKSYDHPEEAPAGFKVPETKDPYFQKGICAGPVSCRLKFDEATDNAVTLDVSAVAVCQASGGSQDACSDATHCMRASRGVALAVSSDSTPASRFTGGLSYPVTVQGRVRGKEGNSVLVSVNGIDFKATDRHVPASVIKGANQDSIIPVQVRLDDLLRSQ